VDDERDEEGLPVDGLWMPVDWTRGNFQYLECDESCDESRKFQGTCHTTREFMAP
jgi:hypothetical protein